MDSNDAMLAPHYHEKILAGALRKPHRCGRASVKHLLTHHSDESLRLGRKSDRGYPI